MAHGATKKTMLQFSRNPDFPVAAEVRPAWRIPRASLTAAAIWLAINPAHAEITPLDQARAAAASRHFTEAESLLRAWLDKHHNDRDARFLLAQVLAGQNKADQSFAVFDHFLRADPGNSDYLLGTAQALQRLRRAEEALPLLKKARRLAPHHEEVWRSQIGALLAAGGENRVRQARLIQAAASRRFPDSQWDEMRRPTRSASAAPVARRASHNDTGSDLLRRARALVDAGRAAEALPLLKQARRLNPRREEIWRLQIAALLDVGSDSGYRQAVVIQEGAVRWFPGSRWDLVPVQRLPAVAYFGNEEPTRGQFLRVGLRQAEGREPALLAQNSTSAAESDTELKKKEADAAESAPAEQEAVAAPPQLALATHLNITAPQARAVPSVAMKMEVPATEAPAKWTELEVGFSYGKLNNGYDNWRSVYVSGQREFGPGKGVYGTLSRVERFAESDRELLVGAYMPLGGRFSGVVEGSVSDVHLLQPKYSALGQVSYQTESGWGASVGLRHTDYNDYGLNVKSATVERYWGSYRAAYTYTVSNLAYHTESATSNQFQANYYYGERNNIGLSYTSGHDVFVYQDYAPTISDTQSIALSGAHWVTKDWAITHELVYHRQDDYYTRRGISIGFRYRF
jgi:YaiO family outer membrane protein